MTAYQCARCPDRSFTSEHALRTHCDTKGHPFRRYFCGLCQKEFGNPTSLAQVFPDQRDQCISKVTIVSYSKHYEDSPAHQMQVCDLCDRSFQTDQGLDDVRTLLSPCPTATRTNHTGIALCGRTPEREHQKVCLLESIRGTIHHSANQQDHIYLAGLVELFFCTELAKVSMTSSTASVKSQVSFLMIILIFEAMKV
jgi:hypothetical protein